MAAAEPMSADTGRSSKLESFMQGVLIGLPVPIVLIILLLALAIPSPPTGRVRFEAAGADISRRGGVALAVRVGGARLEQACNGVCDDLLVEGYGPREVRVLDKDDNCLACEQLRSRPSAGAVEIWSVAGRENLQIKRTSISDGK